VSLLREALARPTPRSGLSENARALAAFGGAAVNGHVALSHRDEAKPFAVVCKRFDGRDREYQRYETAELAELVARRLLEMGLEARVEERAT
jgi:hypothetical protein